MNPAVNEYLSLNKNLTLLNGKIPIEKDWVNTRISEKEILNHNGNLGWVLGSGDLVIDIDPKNGGDKSYKELLKAIGKDDSMVLSPTVTTPSGGFHIYLKIPMGLENIGFNKTLKEYPGIDFLTKGSQCVIAGSTIKEGTYKWVDDLFGFVQNECPRGVIDLVSYEHENSNDNRDLGDFTGLVRIGGSSWSEEKVLGLLGKLDPSMGNDQWVKVGMALHDWDQEKGLELWEKWSIGGDNYVEGDTEKRWRSFDLGGGVTLGTISYMAKEVDWVESKAKINDLIHNIIRADDKKLQLEIIPAIKKMNIDKLDRSRLSKTIQNRYKALEGVSISIADIRKFITPENPREVSGEIMSDDEKPEWCNNWVYVNSHAGFMNLDTLTLHKTESFNTENGKYIYSPDGKKPSAFKWVADRGFITKVDSTMYLPAVKEQIYQMSNGSKILNTFNSKTVPIEASEYTTEGLIAIDMVKNHIRFICGNDNNARVLLSWFAHQVQFPGRQILWSPVIVSKQGLGKTYFSEVLRVCLGDANVGTVSPTQVTSDFNGWATNVIVNVLEELHIVGHNRYDVVNALKPLITDRIIMINDKGIKQYNTYNTANYLCFSNRKDCIPITEDDRRWWVIFSEADNIEEASKMLGESYKTYFPRLFDMTREYGSEIRKWLLEYEISKEFLNTKQAPMTTYKQSMITNEQLSLEGLMETKELIEKGGKYYNKDVVCSSDLFEDLMFEHHELVIQTSRRHLIMKHLGYNILENVVKIDGKTRRVWTKKPMTNEEIRESLADL